MSRDLSDLQPGASGARTVANSAPTARTQARQPRRRFEPGDLFWASLWLGNRALGEVLPLRARLALAGLRGRLVRHQKAAVRERIEHTLGSHLTPEQLQVAADKSLVHLARWRSLAHYRPSRLHAMSGCEVAGFEHLQSSLTLGKGALVVSAHFGYAGLISHILRSRGVEVWQVRAPSSKPRSRERKRLRQVSKFRRSTYKRLLGDPTVIDWPRLLTADFNIRPMVEVLKRNEVLHLLGDGLNTSKVVWCPFLGRRVPFATGYAAIARRTGAPVLPLFAVEAPGNRVRLIVEEPLTVDVTEDAAADIERVVQQFAALWESYVLRYPHLFIGWREEDWFEQRRRRAERIERRPERVTEG